MGITQYMVIPMNGRSVVMFTIFKSIQEMKKEEKEV